MPNGTTHLAGWTQSVDQATLAAINSLSDPQLAPSGALRYLIPSDLPAIQWGMAGGISLTRAQVFTPSIGVRTMNLELIPRKRGTDETLTLTKPEVWIPPAPIIVKPTETIELRTAEDGAGATRQTGFINLGPPQLPPVPAGDIRVMRLTGTTTLTARVWSNVVLTADTSPEQGTYHVIGAVAYSVGVVLARLVFAGGSYRPGFVGFTGTAEGDGMDFDPSFVLKPPLGGYDMGTFTHTTIPTVDVFSVSADTAETVFLFVVRTGDAPGG